MSVATHNKERERLRIVSPFPAGCACAARFRDAAIGAEVADGIPQQANTDALGRGNGAHRQRARRVRSCEGAATRGLVQLIVQLHGLEGIEVDHDGKPISPAAS